MPNAVGSKLFCREVHLTLGASGGATPLVDATFNTSDATGLTVDGLDIDFRIEKSLKATEPNKCEIEIYNLTSDHRKALGGAKALTVSLQAGYLGDTAMLYYGSVRSARSERSGTGMADFVTKISSEDTTARLTGIGGTKKLILGQAAIQIPTGPKMTVQNAINALATALGKQAPSKIPGSLATFQVNGSCILGDARQRMTDICRSAGLEWSVQNGQIQLLAVGQPLQTSQAVQISPDTGLVDSPQVDTQGVAQAKCLLIPEISPGTLVNFIGPGDPSGLAPCLFVQGGYRVDKCRYDGSTYKKEFYVEMTCVKY